MKPDDETFHGQETHSTGRGDCKPDHFASTSQGDENLRIPPTSTLSKVQRGFRV